MISSASAGTMAQVLSALLLAVLVEGRFLAQTIAARNDPSKSGFEPPLRPGSRGSDVFYVLSLLNTLLGISGATLGLTLSLTAVVRDKPVGMLASAFAVGGTAAAILSVMLPPFVYVLLMFLHTVADLIDRLWLRTALIVTTILLMVMAFAGIAWLVWTMLSIEARAG